MNHRKTFLIAALSSASFFAMASTAIAQDVSSDEDEIIAVGIRQSLENALLQERNADSLIEVILAEDIGKLPDQNLAEVLENVTGVQITRTAGVGTGVQIRGTNANRVEFNGVSTVGSGAGRSGIDFEDVNPAIIAGVEVVKASEAKTIEGSVGGTINLKTIRPLDLKETLAAIRIQGEDSNLSTEGITPRISGAFGKKWEGAEGRGFGFVVSGSYTEQESVSFRPRADRDRLDERPGDNPSEFLGIQFLLQEQENFDYETINLAGTFEAEPAENLRIYADAIINEQERAQDSYRIQASGVSSLRSFATPTTFETVDFGVGPGQVQAALTGFLEPDLAVDDDDPNLRFSSDTGARVTDSAVLAIGGEWQATDRLNAHIQFASTTSDTVNPNLSTTLNFINPNCPLDGGASGDPSTSNDNCVPYVYDLSNNSLSFGVNFNSPFAPTVEDLLNPANVVLDQVDVARNTTENKEEAFRLDFDYDLEGAFNQDFLKSLEFGYRRNKSSSVSDRMSDRIGGFSRLEDSPNGLLFQELLVPGPDNFGDADGRDLFVANFLLVDPDRAFSDPEGTLAILERALADQRALEPQADGDLVAVLSSDQNAFYDVRETTDAFYAQLNLERGIFRGNIGVRYLETEVDSTAFGPDDGSGNRTLQTTTGSYDFVLPRANLTITPSEDLVLRASYGTDIRRPDFDYLNTAFVFTQNENTAVALGNPGLEPEEVDSFDISADWYFAPAAVVSIGYFNKKRTNLFGVDFEGALLSPGSTDSGLARETNPSCPGGGIFNPLVIPNQFGDPNTTGLCVDFTIPGNDPDTTTQEGVEIAFQYDFSNWEDRLGSFAWASGFGVLANYTHQTFSGGSEVDSTSGRGQQVLGDVSIPRGLLDFSKNAYNLTLFYEKYGLSARARYTWREAFRTQDFGGGASGNSTFSFPVWTLDRGQLNASVIYDVTDNFSVGVEGVNLTTNNIYQHCVAKTGPLCFSGFPDRRIVFGGSYKF